MPSTLVAAGASSFISKNHSGSTNCSINFKATPTCSKPLLTQRSTFQGGVTSLEVDAKWSRGFLPKKKKKSSFGFKVVTARAAAGASKTIEAEVDKPLGLTLGQKSGGGVVITGVEGGGNAAKAGLKAGDQVLYTSSFFGDELWPADKLGFTKTAIQAKPDSVYFVVSRKATYSG
ncbi:hypothetical protein Tsubulata_028502 [Turnera subulata]|uniref:PDZ domain-containing protein n=1 Tax=Turnera subulata TaxID=218843 RepID=A0A9Q0FAD5_9ROSI|nr:hypothetical protein Tsubulata_028502 [Turnera subulata]